MTLEMLRLIIAICAVNSLEDKRGNWTEYDKLEKYQRECRVYYYDCLKEKNLETCDRQRRL
jgi:hypothetical protein